jgi:survival of motor neuron protein-interacting protein 1
MGTILKRDEESLRDDDELLPLAFHVDGPPESLEGPPSSAEEYLRRVKHEAAHIPSVVRKEIDPNLMRPLRPQIGMLPAEGICECPSELLPTTEWEGALIEWFDELRRGVARTRQLWAQDHRRRDDQVELPPVRNNSDWKRVCFGVGSDGAPDTAEPRHRPLLSLMFSIEERMVERALCVWFDFSDEASKDERETNETEIPNPKPTINARRAEWLFALLSCAPQPLQPRTVACLRGIFKLLIAQRASLTTPDDQLLPHLNDLITIIGVYFRQAARVT